MVGAAKLVVRILAVFNIIFGALFLLLVGAMLFTPAPFLGSMARLWPQADAPALLTAARLAMALVVPATVAAYILFAKLLAILDTVSAGDPFVADNADRLRTIAWALLAIQICDVLFGIVGTWFDSAAGERISGWSPGVTGWVAVLLAFVLARVFREGARLRDDAELTV